MLIVTFSTHFFTFFVSDDNFTANKRAIFAPQNEKDINCLQR